MPDPAGVPACIQLHPACIRCILVVLPDPFCGAIAALMGALRAVSPVPAPRAPWPMVLGWGVSGDNLCATFMPRLCGAVHALSPKRQVVKVFMRISFIVDSHRTRRDGRAAASIAILAVLQRPTESNGHLWYCGMAVGGGPG